MRLGSQSDRGWYWGALTYVGLSFSTLSWVPTFSGGGTDLELSNMVQLIFILILPGLFVFSRRATPVTLLFSLLIAWDLVMLLALTLHGSGGGTGVVQQQLAATLFGWSLALCIANSEARIGRVAMVALVVYIAALEFSAIRAESSVFLGAFDFLRTLNRDEFIYRVMRPILNVFTSADEDLVFLASEVNNLANTMVLLACTIFFRGPGEEARTEGLIGGLVAAVGLILAFIIFSTSGVVVAAVFLLALLLKAASRLSLPMRILLILLTAALILALIQPISTFVAVNLADDQASRGARVEQYEYAVGAINSSILFGVGFSKAGGNVIHNWALFSWTTAGIVAFFLVLAAYLWISCVAVLLARAVPRSFPSILAMLVLFIMRTSVGGAGGIPSGPSILAAALLTGLLVRYERRIPQPRQVPLRRTPDISMVGRTLSG